jgi:hypothetical protein
MIAFGSQKNSFFQLTGDTATVTFGSEVSHLLSAMTAMPLGRTWLQPLIRVHMQSKDVKEEPQLTNVGFNDGRASTVCLLNLTLVFILGRPVDEGAPEHR